MRVYIGRQPIYNAQYAIEGYELLYRTGEENRVKVNDADTATRAVLSEAVSIFGLPQLTNGLPAFINFTRNLLLDNFASLMPPSDVIIEVPGNILVDDKLEAKLMELHGAGYRLSLNSYSENNGLLKFNRISDLFDIIRMDVSKNNRLQLKDMIRKLRGRYSKLLAEKVETEEQFDIVTNLNFSLFQGYFFEKPVCLKKDFSFSRTSYGMLLNALMMDNVNYDLCLKIIMSDPILTHLFLSSLVPGANAVRTGVESQIRRGLVRMGLHELQHWIGLIVLKQNNNTASNDVPLHAYTRGLFIEQLMEKSITNANPTQGFFLGLLSLLDSVTGTSLQDLLQDLQVHPLVRMALEGPGENEYTKYLQYAMIYERGGESYGYKLPQIRFTIPEETVSLIYMQAMRDADAAWAGMVTKALTAYQGTILKR